MRRHISGVFIATVVSVVWISAAQRPAAPVVTAQKPSTYLWPWTPPANPPKADGFTFTWDNNHLDLNGLPLNGDWSPDVPNTLPKVIPTCLHPSASSVSTCDSVPGADRAQDWKLLVCRVAGSPFPGHVNWTPATFTGYVSWGNLADDGDDNLFFEPDDAAGLTHANHTIDNDPTRPYIELEFASRETIERVSTAAWTALRDAIDRWASEPIDSSEIDATLNSSHPGTPSRAVVTGLFGLDCEHGCPSEVHPVYGLAIETNDSPEDDTWILLARNWGNEGFCSRLVHCADTSHVIMALPGLSAGEPAISATEFASSDEGTPAPSIAFQNDRSIVVDFSLPDPGDAGLVELVLHLKWSDSTARALSRAKTRPGPRAAVTRVQLNREESDFEHFSAGLGHARPTMERTAKATPPTAIGKTSRRSMIPQLERRNFVRPAPVSRARSVTASRTLTRLQDQAEGDERKMLLAICDANANHLPGLSGTDSARVCQQVRR